MQTINERLTALPTLLRYDSPAALAKASGIDPNTLRKAMQGPSKPGFDILRGLLSRHEQLSPYWLVLGKGEPLESYTPITAANEPAVAYACAAPAAVTTLSEELAELRAENKDLKAEIKQARREAREDLIAQARTYNSVKDDQTVLISRLRAKVDEYELLLGYRKPTAAERQQQEQAGSGAPRLEMIPFGARYRTPVEEPQAAKKQGGKVLQLYPFSELPLYPSGELSDCEAA
jgi:FtsZ-binding cell division protein ZapB